MKKHSTVLPAQPSDNTGVPPHTRKKYRRATAALLTVGLGALLTGCQTTPVDRTAGWIRVEPQISVLKKKTYEIQVTDLSNQGHVDFILGPGSRSAQWLTPGPQYHVQVYTVTPKGEHIPGLNRKDYCDKTVATHNKPNMVIVVTADGCHIEH